MAVNPVAVAALATDPSARVLVLIDGQNLYKSCRRVFGHSLCHPHLLAEHLAGPRTASRVGVRFYTGRPSPNISGEKDKARNLDRRISGMQANGVTVCKRQLRYHWDWGHQHKLPNPAAGAQPQLVFMEPWQRPQEKGIDVMIALDSVEFLLTDVCDVLIVVSLDRDLAEIPQSVRRLASFRKKPYRLEAAVPVGASQIKPKQLKAFDHTHQISAAMFGLVRDDTDYAADDANWTPPVHPPDLATAAKNRGLTYP